MFARYIVGHFREDGNLEYFTGDFWSPNMKDAKRFRDRENAIFWLRHFRKSGTSVRLVKRHWRFGWKESVEAI